VRERTLRLFDLFTLAAETSGVARTENTCVENTTNLIDLMLHWVDTWPRRYMLDEGLEYAQQLTRHMDITGRLSTDL
jgi:hypothetical protein